MRWAWLLVLAACKSNAPVVSDAGADAGIDAGPKPFLPPPKAKPLAFPETKKVEKPDAALSFKVHTRIPPGITTRLFPIEDGIVVAQSSTAAGSKSDRETVSVITANGTRALPGVTVDDETVSHVRGSSSLLFVTVGKSRLVRVSAAGITRLPGRHADVVELRRGQWVGLALEEPREMNTDDGVVTIDDSAGEYRVVSGTEGTVPLVPSSFRPRNAIRVADGKICALVEKRNDDVRVNGGLSETGVWLADVDGHQYFAPFDDAGLLFRGVDGTCQVLTLGGVARVEGDVPTAVSRSYLSTVGLGHYGGSRLPTADRDGGLWFIAEGSDTRRMVVTSALVTITKYPLPQTIEGATHCPHPEAKEVVGLSANDVWVLARCRDEQWHYLEEQPQLLIHGS